MLKRLTSLLLLLAVAAGVASGAPTHSGGRECPMKDSMGAMDCCEHARSPGDSPEAKAARLCCAVNCPGDGKSGAASEAKAPAPQAAPSHPAAVPAAVAVTTPRERLRALPPHTNESPPVYLLNLAFLI